MWMWSSIWTNSGGFFKQLSPSFLRERQSTKQLLVGQIAKQVLVMRRESQPLKPELCSVLDLCKDGSQQLPSSFPAALRNFRAHTCDCQIRAENFRLCKHLLQALRLLL